MTFDFTSEVKLNSGSRKTYRVLQGLLYLSAFIFGFYLFFALLFPTGHFVFSFINFNSNKNTLKDPKNVQGESLDRGKIKAGEAMLADASIVGNYSEAEIFFKLNSKSDKLENGKIEIHKSFRAFLFPEGAPEGFQDGSLLRSENNLYFVSQGKIRKFANQKIATTLGYSQNNFEPVSEEELAHNQPGESINDDTNYPDGALFKVEEDFYLLSRGKLNKFVSSAACLSRFNEKQAVLKNENFLKNFEISEELLGFSDGSLIAYGESAYIVSGNEIQPIGDPVIFESSGFIWNELIKVSGDEIAMYLKGKMFALDSPHPNGTVFYAEDTEKFYIIKNGQKHLLSGEKAALSWNKRMPIRVNDASLKNFSECVLEKRIAIFGSAFYSCKASLENLADFFGKDYEISFISENEIKIDQMNLNLKKAVKMETLRMSIFNLLGKIKGNYGYVKE